MEKSDEPKTERFNMFMSPSEMKAIDDWAWRNKIRSKSEAVRRLVQIGIAFEDAGERIEEKATSLVETLDTLSEKALGTDRTEEAPIELIAAIVKASHLLLVLEHLSKTATDLRSGKSLKDLIEAAERLRQAAKPEDERK